MGLSLNVISKQISVLKNKCKRAQASDQISKLKGLPTVAPIKEPQDPSLTNSTDLTNGLFDRALKIFFSVDSI